MTFKQDAMSTTGLQRGGSTSVFQPPGGASLMAGMPEGAAPPGNSGQMGQAPGTKLQPANATPIYTPGQNGPVVNNATVPQQSLVMPSTTTPQPMSAAPQQGAYPPKTQFIPPGGLAGLKAASSIPGLMGRLQNMKSPVSPTLQVETGTKTMLANPPATPAARPKLASVNVNRKEARAIPNSTGKPAGTMGSALRVRNTVMQGDDMYADPEINSRLRKKAAAPPMSMMRRIPGIDRALGMTGIAGLGAAGIAGASRGALSPTITEPQAAIPDAKPGIPQLLSNPDESQNQSPSPGLSGSGPDAPDDLPGQADDGSLQGLGGNAMTGGGLPLPADDSRMPDPNAPPATLPPKPEPTPIPEFGPERSGLASIPGMGVPKPLPPDQVPQQPVQGSPEWMQQQKDDAQKRQWAQGGVEFTPNQPQPQQTVNTQPKPMSAGVGPTPGNPMPVDVTGKLPINAVNVSRDMQTNRQMTTPVQPHPGLADQAQAMAEQAPKPAPAPAPAPTPPPPTPAPAPETAPPPAPAAPAPTPPTGRPGNRQVSYEIEPRDPNAQHGAPPSPQQVAMMQEAGIQEGDPEWYTHRPKIAPPAPEQQVGRFSHQISQNNQNLERFRSELESTPDPKRRAVLERNIRRLSFINNDMERRQQINSPEEYKQQYPDLNPSAVDKAFGPGGTVPRHQAMANNAAGGKPLYANVPALAPGVGTSPLPPTMQQRPGGGLVQGQAPGVPTTVASTMPNPATTPLPVLRQPPIPRLGDNNMAPRTPSGAPGRRTPPIPKMGELTKEANPFLMSAMRGISSLAGRAKPMMSNVGRTLKNLVSGGTAKGPMLPSTFADDVAGVAGRGGRGGVDLGIRTGAPGSVKGPAQGAAQAAGGGGGAGVPPGTPGSPAAASGGGLPVPGAPGAAGGARRGWSEFLSHGRTPLGPGFDSWVTNPLMGALGHSAVGYGADTVAHELGYDTNFTDLGLATGAGSRLLPNRLMRGARNNPLTRAKVPFTGSTMKDVGKRTAQGLGTVGAVGAVGEALGSKGVGLGGSGGHYEDYPTDGTNPASAMLRGKKWVPGTAGPGNLFSPRDWAETHAVRKGDEMARSFGFDSLDQMRQSPIGQGVKGWNEGGIGGALQGVWGTLTPEEKTKLIAGGLGAGATLGGAGLAMAGHPIAGGALGAAGLGGLGYGLMAPGGSHQELLSSLSPQDAEKALTMLGENPNLLSMIHRPSAAEITKQLINQLPGRNELAAASG